MDTKEKRKSFSLSGWLKSKFVRKPIPDPGIEKCGDINYLLGNTDEWPLHEDGYYTCKKFNNEEFYN